MHRSFRIFRNLKKYSLSSETQLVKVGRISEISEKSPNPRQLWLRRARESVQISLFVCSDRKKSEASTFFLEIFALNGPRDFIFGKNVLIYVFVCQKKIIFEISHSCSIFSWVFIFGSTMKCIILWVNKAYLPNKGSSSVNFRWSHYRKSKKKVLKNQKFQK